MFKDARGQGDYDVFKDMVEGQINVSKTYPGIIRAFHRHKHQFDYWYIVSGQFEVVLFDPFEEKLTVKYLGPGESIRIDPLVWHGFKVLGTEMGTLLYWVTKKFDPSNPDEERANWFEFYDWEVEFK